MTKNITPVLLLTGYLGSGKTTLVNRILANKRGIKFAVIVNDIGEVNIDADLIEKGGVVDQKDDSLVALQNGCICCTLKMDLVEQLHDIISMHRFDYIVIEASGICEPAPIAQTICSIPQMEPKYTRDGVPQLDCIVTVVDALRLKDEFGSGADLMRHDIDDEDIENLVIQQIEFCNIILLNKASEVEPKELERIRQIIRALQPKAEIIDCDYGDVDLDKIINTRMFDFERVATSATWIDEIENHHADDDDDDDDDEHEHDEHHHHDADEHDHDEHHHHHHHADDDDDEHDHHHHEHHHHHHHHDDEGEAEEYGIGTFVYYRRRPFDIGLFDEFVARRWPKSVIRAKGMCYFRSEQHLCYVFEQAGRQFSLKNAGQWYATMPKDQLRRLMEAEPQLLKDWDEQYGDRMQKIVFIGQKMDREAIEAELDKCLV
ncbi:MAG: GTP-binding protein [Bacteroidaceae bacterium]|nr:GTP-binding protein [Bacteroidaceae bacterium]